MNNIDIPTLAHELGHIYQAFQSDPALDKAFIRPAQDGSGEVEALYASAVDGGVENPILACLFAFCASHPDIAAQLLQRSAQNVASVFQGIVDADAELWGVVFRASDGDIDAIRSAGAIEPAIWHHGLATSVMFTKARGFEKNMATLLAEYHARGMLCLHRSDVEKMMPA